MKTKFCVLAVCVVVALSHVGCSTTEKVGNSSLAKNQSATIQVVTKYGSGSGARSSRIRAVDGDSVGDSASYVTVGPGPHTVSFDFEQIVDPGGRFRFSINFFGNESDVVKPRARSAISSTNPITVSGTLDAGKTYYVDISSLTFNPVPLTESEKQMKAALGDFFKDRFFLDGSVWLRQKK